LHYPKTDDILVFVSARRIATTTRSVNVRAFLAVLLTLCFATAVAGCGSAHISIDKKNAQQVAAAWLGESNGRPKASCRRHICEIWIRQPFVDTSEAWLLAVPITTYYRGQEYPGVDRIILRITDKHRGRVATFLCSLPRSPTGTFVKATNVSDAHKMCKGSVAPTSDS